MLWSGIRCGAQMCASIGRISPCSGRPDSKQANDAHKLYRKGFSAYALFRPYGNPINPIKVLVYQITTDDSVFHVKETYRLNESKTVPQNITVYGTCKNQYFDIYIQYLTERPSVAWLSSFGLREYVEAG